MPVQAGIEFVGPVHEDMQVGRRYVAELLEHDEVTVGSEPSARGERHGCRGALSSGVRARMTEEPWAGAGDHSRTGEARFRNCGGTGAHLTFGISGGF